MLPRLGFDIEAKTLVDMVALGRWQAFELARIERTIRDRMAQVEAGVTNPASFPTAHHWTAQLQSLDPLLRLRWDFKQGWVIERAVAEWGCWAICGVIGERYIPLNLIDVLRRADMQRYAPGEYLARKREAARLIRESNAKRGDDLVSAAVDKLTDKRCQEFIDVTRAIETGETITAHGETEKSLDRMRAASLRAATRGEYRE